MIRLAGQFMIAIKAEPHPELLFSEPFSLTHNSTSFLRQMIHWAAGPGFLKWSKTIGGSPTTVLLIGFIIYLSPKESKSEPQILDTTADAICGLVSSNFQIRASLSNLNNKGQDTTVEIPNAGVHQDSKSLFSTFAVHLDSFLPTMHLCQIEGMRTLHATWEHWRIEDIVFHSCGRFLGVTLIYYVANLTWSLWKNKSNYLTISCILV